MLLAACAILTVLAGFYVLLPLFKEPERSLEVDLLSETELDRLLDRKQVTYNNIKDLEFEYRMGRLSDADFQRMEAGYKSEAAVILRRLDQLGAAEDSDETIEREITSRRTRLSGFGSSVAGNSSRCPSCGAEVFAGKRFCADCGHRL